MLVLEPGLAPKEVISMVMSCLFHAVGGLKTMSLLVEGHGERPRRNFFVCLSPRLSARASGCKIIGVHVVISPVAGRSKM